VSRMEWNIGLGHAFEEAVRKKPVARWTPALCKLNGAKETCLTDYNNDPAVTFTDLQKSRGDSGSSHQTPGYGGTVGRDRSQAGQHDRSIVKAQAAIVCGIAVVKTSDWA